MNMIYEKPSIKKSTSPKTDVSLKRLFFWITFFTVFAFSDNSYWTDKNGCSYCLNGWLNGGNCVSERNGDSFYSQKNFSIRKVNSNLFLFDYGYKSHLQVFCINKMAYCKTINDSMVIKFEPSLGSRKKLCKKQSESSVNTGMLYSYNFAQGNVEFLCDFVEVDYKKSFFKVLGEGFCPVQVKRKGVMPNPTTRQFYGLYITKRKSFEIRTEKILIEIRKSENPLFENSKVPQKKDFFSVGYCAASHCEILNYLEMQNHDFDVKCDFIKKNENRLNEVEIMGEGFCPIEILDRNNRKQTYYVRSVKGDKGYKLLMTNVRQR